MIAFGLFNACIGMRQTRRHRIPCVSYLLDHLHRLLSIWS
jgi:hypothetical protein